MNGLTVSLSRLAGVDLPLPSYQTLGSAGMDLPAAVLEPVTLAPGERRLIPCGFSIALPDGYEAQIRPRSGLAHRFGVTVLNAPGTIDADYRGEVCALLVNHGSEPFIVKRGDRIAQLVVTSVARVDWSVVEALPATSRGGGGFGHTG